MTLNQLALSRATLDRAAHRRSENGLVERLGADPRTRVLVLHSDRVPVVDGDAGPQLMLLPGPQGLALRAEIRAGSGEQTQAADGGAVTADGSVRAPEAGVEVFLGELAGQDYLLAAVGPAAALGIAGHPQPELPELGVPGARWASIRELGMVLDDTGAGLITAGVAVANWHANHQRCARCGDPTEPIQAGWARRCPSCGAEHYPRTDPAVIMSVLDPDGRILLGRQRAWPERRFSTLAGFVEPGESLEAAVRREVFEEAGVLVDQIEYLGSQPWPFPSSLMLGFRSRAVQTAVTVDGEELSEGRWWTRQELEDDVRAGRLLLPPGLSIARRIIENWFGRPIEDAAEAWR